MLLAFNFVKLLLVFRWLKPVERSLVVLVIARKQKIKKIEIANVMAKVPCINSYFKANNGNNVLNSPEKTSSMLYF